MKIIIVNQKQEDFPVNNSSKSKSFEGTAVEAPEQEEMGYRSSKQLSLLSLLIIGTVVLVFFGLTATSAYVYSVQWNSAEEKDGVAKEPVVDSELFKDDYINDRPIIGILAQEYYIDDNYEHPNLSYIASSYVKFVEGSGARAVPIFIRQNESYYEKMFSGINGLLLPGGAVYFNDSGYSAAGQILVKLAKDAYDNNGDYFPVFGTCLGFQFLVYEVLKNDVLAYCDSWNSSDNLEFTEDTMDSKLFGTAPDAIMELLATANLTANFHRRCLTLDNILDNSLTDHFKFLSWTPDAVSKVPYVSSMESTKYPIFGIQFHPEKNLYEWNTRETIPHSANAITVAQYFGNFFVNQARRNSHKFDTEEEEDSFLIYNYAPEFTGEKPTSTFEQRYIFPIEK